MRTLIILAAALGLGIAGSTAVSAQDATNADAQSKFDFSTLDADASGTISYEELLMVVPDLTGEAFAAADADASGELSAEELVAFEATQSTM